MKNFKRCLTRRPAGFTLMEMVIVVVVIGVLAGMAVPGFLSYIPKMRVKSQARDIVSQLRLARAQAITERKPYGVAIVLDKQCSVFFADLDGDPDSFDPGADSTIKENVSPKSVKMTSCSLNNGCVTFNSTGSASSSGDVQLVSSDGEVIMSINILASTGRVRLTEIGAG